LEFDRLLTRGINYPVLKIGEYEINILSAFRYLGGQYLRFEDILLQDEVDSIFEDGMRFISTRYLLKDRETVLKQINSLAKIGYRFSDDYDVFYQLEEDGEEGCFLAEYLVGLNWITLSTFGDLDTYGLRYFNVFGRRQDPHGAAMFIFVLRWVAVGAVFDRQFFTNNL
jgi:hypothetical protein